MALTTDKTEKRAVAQAIAEVTMGTAASQGISVHFSDKGGRNGTASRPNISNPPAARKNSAAKAVPNAAAKRAERK